MAVPSDRDPTPPLDVFLADYEDDDNCWWVIGCGHHQNLFESAVEWRDHWRSRADAMEADRDHWRMRAQVAEAKTKDDAGSKLKPAIDQDLFDKSKSPPGWWWTPTSERHLHEYEKRGVWGYCRHESCSSTTYLGADRNADE